MSLASVSFSFAVLWALPGGFAATALSVLWAAGRPGLERPNRVLRKAVTGSRSPLTLLLSLDLASALLLACLVPFLRLPSSLAGVFDTVPGVGFFLVGLAASQPGGLVPTARALSRMRMSTGRTRIARANVPNERDGGLLRELLDVEQRHRAQVRRAGLFESLEKALRRGRWPA